MKNFKQFIRQYDISFAGLKEGVHLFEFEVKREFFEAFEYDEFEDVNQKIQAKLVKKSNLMELFLHSEGEVRVPCDVTGELFCLQTDNDLDIIIRFGEEYNDDNDEFIILPFGEHKLNVAQFIYEMVVLSVPAKRLSPEAIGMNKDEDFDTEEENNLLSKLETKEQNIEIDPRWDKLKELLNK